MFKFLRKYNKWILAVGGVLLMITFLIPQAITGLSQQQGARAGTYATLDGDETVSAGEYDRAQRELLVVQRMMGGLPGIGFVQEPAHWLLLTREAEQAGLIPAPQTVDDTILQYYQSATGERDENLLRETAVKVQGVGELVRLYTTYGLYSDRRLSTAADRLLHTVTAQLVVLEAKAEDAEFTPAEEEIKTQFEAYRDKLKGEGELGFGYKLPNRLKLEWIEIPRAAVEKAVEASKEFSGVALQMHWKRNPSGTFPTVETGKPVPEIVRADLLNKLTTEKMDAIGKSASDQLRLNQRGLATQDGYLILPPDWTARQLDLQTLAGDLQTHSQIELPAYEAIGDRWLTIEEAAALEGVGQSTTDKFGQPTTLAQLLPALKEFEPAAAVVANAGSALVQAGVALPPLKGPGNSLFIARVTAAEASREPESVDEVRDAVVADLKRKAAYELLKGQLAALEAEAEEKGLLSFALAHDTIVQPASSVYLINPFTLSQQQQNPNVQTGPAPLPVIGADRKAIEAIIDYARTLPDETVIAKLSDPERILAVPADDKLAVVVAKLVSENPLSRELYTSLLQQGALHGVLAREERDAAAEETADDEPEENPFSFAAISRRHDFKLNAPALPVDDAAEADAAADTARAAATTD